MRPKRGKMSDFKRSRRLSSRSKYYHPEDCEDGRREPSYNDERRSKSNSRERDYRERDRYYREPGDYRRSRSSSRGSRSRSRSHSPHSRRHKRNNYNKYYQPEECEYEDDRERYYREKEHYRRSRSSNSGTRWDNKEDRTRSKDRYHEKEEYDSEDSGRSSSCGVIGASGSEIIGYKSQPPNNTIMIRGLAQHITENDIRQDIIHCGLMPKDIRLIRKKDTGASRGFAFVEFSSLGEATRWMDVKQGILMLQDQYRAIMQYSIPKELCPQSEKAPIHKASADWFCIKCGAQNFKRRELCFKCHASRLESEEGGSGCDEICSYTTKTLMLRNLDALTTEDTVMTVLNSIVPELVKKISAVSISRDPLTSTSRGICYLGTETTIDALGLYGALNGLGSPLNIDGKTVIISYCKYNMGDSKHVYSEPESYNYSPNNINSLAQYSANKYAKNSEERQQYYMYYKDYYTQQMNQSNSGTLQQENQMDAANAAAAVAQSAIRQLHANKTFFDTTHMSIPSGTDGKRYPIPDVTKYTYDKASGYYYDPQSGLYYDQNSQYYWNSVIQKYLYYDREKLTYVLAPTGYDNYNVAQQNVDDSAQGASGKKSKGEKQDKVKVAKKIQKDMERWAKTLNQKRDMQPSKFNDGSSGNQNANVGSADIGFSVLEKKAANHSFLEPDAAQTPLVAAYGGESESSGDEDEPKINDLDFLDFNTLICNLCKRMLANAEALTKHAQFSAIHKQNVENLRSKKRKPDGAATASEKVVYRDRAKERRLKYGDPDEPQPSKLKEKYLKSREIEMPVAAASVSEPIGAENVGNRLLQKMGWTEGQGLGKSNQGRTTIIQAEQRVSSVGLGNKTGSYQALAGESYKDCVKKMMYARYQEFSEKEN